MEPNWTRLWQTAHRKICSRDEFVSKFDEVHDNSEDYIYEYIFQKLSKESKIISLDYSLVNFFVNGIDRGIFVIEEGFSKELLEKNGRRNGPIFGINDRQGRNFPEIIFEAYLFEPDTTFVILLSLCSLSPGLIRSGE